MVLRGGVPGIRLAEKRRGFVLGHDLRDGLARHVGDADVFPAMEEKEVRAHNSNGFSRDALVECDAIALKLFARGLAEEF